MKKPNAFTLVELILVILLITIVFVILLPTLSVSTGEPTNISTCLGNLMDLSNGWFMYSFDNNDSLVGGDIGQAEFDWINEPLPDYNQETYSNDEEKRIINKGPLWNYVQKSHSHGPAINVYHCPEDYRWLEEYGPWLSYSIIGGLNGQDRYEKDKRNYTVAVKYNQIKQPEEKIVFVEEDAINGSNPRSWQIYDPDDLNKWTWQDPIAMRHNQRNAFGFADGHAESRRWEDERTFEMCEPEEEAKMPGHVEQKDNPDLLWIKQRYTWLPKK